MNEREVAAVLSMLVAAKPGVRLDERTPDVWMGPCATVDPDVGMEAANRMIAELKATDRFPTPADFLAQVRAVKRAREPFAELDTGSPLPAGEALAHVAKAREPLPAPRPAGVPPDLAAKVAATVEAQSSCDHDYQFDHVDGRRVVDRCVLCGRWQERAPVVPRIDPAGAVGGQA